MGTKAMDGCTKLWSFESTLYSMYFVEFKVNRVRLSNLWYDLFSSSESLSFHVISDTALVSRRCASIASDTGTGTCILVTRCIVVCVINACVILANVTTAFVASMRRHGACQ